MPASNITIRVYTVDPETGQRHDVHTVRHTGQPPRASTFRARWPDCDCPQHHEQT